MPVQDASRADLRHVESRGTRRGRAITRLPRRVAVPLIVALVSGAWGGVASADDAFTTAGSVLQIALPVTAAVCATYQHRLTSYATGFVALTAVTQGLKHSLGDAPINKRPNGSAGGFPSGHTAAAFSGATDLALNCAPGSIAVGVTAGAAAALVGASRIHADEHTLLQVLAGAALGALSTGITVTSTPAGGYGLTYALHF